MRSFVAMLTAILATIGTGIGSTSFASHSETAQQRHSAALTPIAGCPAAEIGPHSAAPSIPGGGKTVALTFDDGPGASTAAILSILQSFHVPATFFNIGVQEAQWPDDVRAEAALGLLIGDHTWDHPDLVTLSAGAQAAEIEKGADEQESFVGSSPCVLRPPYGDYDATTLALANERHLAVWLWDVDTEDWKAEGSSSSYWVNRIISLAESEGGALSHPVVLMHNQSISMPATVAALPTIIRYFESRGYTFVNLLGRSGPPMSCASRPTEEPGTVVAPGSRLASGASLESPNGQFLLVMQADGNLVAATASGHPLWQSKTSGNPGAFAVMQTDGDLVVRSATGRSLWASDTGAHAGAWLEVQADGTWSSRDRLARCGVRDRLTLS
jgi:peptidoglycan/xylan/chitin deacetylase (PgdA/CDA1 family)